MSKKNDAWTVRVQLSGGETVELRTLNPEIAKKIQEDLRSKAQWLSRWVEQIDTEAPKSV